LAVFPGAKNPTGQTVLLKKFFLRKLNFFIFSCSLPSGLISLLSNAIVVCRLFIVRQPILRAVIVRLRQPPLSLFAVAVVIFHHH
jgi:hypothetical protein